MRAPSSTTFKPGQSGNPTGKSPGTVAKKWAVQEALARADCDPFFILACIAIGDVSQLKNVSANDAKYLTFRLRLEAAAELAQYCAPKLKAVEFSQDKDNPLKFELNLSKAVKGANAKPKD